MEVLDPQKVRADGREQHAGRGGRVNFVEEKAKTCRRHEPHLRSGVVLAVGNLFDESEQNGKICAARSECDAAPAIRSGRDGHGAARGPLERAARRSAMKGQVHCNLLIVRWRIEHASKVSACGAKSRLVGKRLQKACDYAEDVGVAEDESTLLIV